MIYWAPFLHFYQPPIQFHAVLKKVCNESYRPLVKMFLERPATKVTINICGVLTELLNDHGAKDVLDGIRQLAKNKQLEFVDSAKYHAILPLIPKEEIKRQIRLNQKTNGYFFKKAYKARGFFMPEMCYSASAAGVIRDMDYDWVLISGIACQGQWPMDFICSVPCGPSLLKVFFRDDILSNKISFRSIDSAGFIRDLINLSKGKKDIYCITAMDAETFGHHIRNWEKLFLAKVYEVIDKMGDIYNEKDTQQKAGLAGVYKKIFADLKEIPHIEIVTISELLKKFPIKKAKAPRSSSWSTTKEDVTKKNYYPLWKGKGNRIHDLQWEHLNICFELVRQAVDMGGSSKEGSRFAILARSLLDRAVYSCQFWWANKERGTWDINLINKGLILQEETILNAYKAVKLSSADEEAKRVFHHKVAACRDIANQIRDLLVLE